jgi:magnesium transporter
MSDQLPNLIEEVVAAPEQGDEKALASIVAIQDVNDTALLLESLPYETRIEVWETVPKHKQLDVLVAMRGDPRESIIDSYESEELDAIFNDIDAEQLLEIADSLPNKLIDRISSLMDKKQRKYFEDASQYDEDEIGHWLSHELLVLPLNAKVKDGLRLIRRDIPNHVDTIFLVNRAGQFSEAVKVHKLFSAPEHLQLLEISEEYIDVIKAKDDSYDASQLVQKSGFAALPVVNENNTLLGRLDVKTAYELTKEHYERQIMATAGMDENEDLFAPVRKSAKSRALWLGINLLTAFLASWLIGMFEATLQEVVALAVLMPVVASMGGIAGSQTLTLIVRGLAMGQVTGANVKALVSKELRVGGLNGVIWAIVIGVVAYFWFSDSMLGVVIGLAILLNIIAAAFAGVAVPIILDKLKLDPALSGSVILTTVTDSVGFVVFLGLGTMFLL